MISTIRSSLHLYVHIQGQINQENGHGKSLDDHEETFFFFKEVIDLSVDVLKFINKSEVDVLHDDNG